MNDYVTVVEVDDSTSKEHSIQQLVKRQCSIPEDSSFVTVLTINDKHNDDNNGNHSNNTSNSVQHIKTYASDKVECFENANMNIHSTTIANEKNHNFKEIVYNRDENKNTNAELDSVIIYRLPGERLGLGLKFQGGTRNTEKVQKLFIQSCAKDSPASKVATCWGFLREGDEIVSIDGHAVSDMTRIECVNRLQDNVAIKMDIRNGHGLKPVTKEQLEFSEEEHMNISNENSDMIAFERLQSMSNDFVTNRKKPPPPVPPRKMTKHFPSMKEKTFDIIDFASTSLDSDLSMTGTKPFTPPPDAEYYINLFADGQSLKTESESDDTASTISTVIDKFSLSNFSSETDLSSYASFNSVGTDLTNVLNPFKIIEQDNKVKTAQVNNISRTYHDMPDNNYETIDPKTEINASENMGLNVNNENKGPNLDKVSAATQSTIPTPKPRQFDSGTTTTVISTSPTSANLSKLPTESTIMEAKKRSILPLPRKKTALPMPIPIEVSDMKISVSKEQENSNQHIQSEPSNEVSDSSGTTPTQAATTIKVKMPMTSSSTPSKELITKIPKAIASIFSPNSNRSIERAKTESEMNVKARRTNPSANIMIQQKASSLEMENMISTISPNSPVSSSSESYLKTRIPTPKQRHGSESITTPKRGTDKLMSNAGSSPRNGVFTPKPRMLVEKQKSETDLNLGQRCNKSNDNLTSPNTKSPLVRTQSAESKLRTPERSLIPALITTPSTSRSSMESVSGSNAYSNARNSQNRGPKPKPPERIDSLRPKKPIEKEEHQQNLTVAITGPSGSQQNSTPTEDIFEEPASVAASPASSVTPTSSTSSSGIRFKIQTYDSKMQNSNNGDNKELVPPLLIDINGNQLEQKLMYSGKQNVEHQATKPITNPEILSKSMIDDDVPMLDNETPPTIIMGKCIKVNDYDENATYYSSSSSEDEGVESVDNVMKDIEDEDGEKLGPPEVINGPGPSEAYFNFCWHSNILPTIGEVAEEELSSLEYSLTNRPVQSGVMSRHESESSHYFGGSVKGIRMENKNSEVTDKKVSITTIQNVDLKIVQQNPLTKTRKETECCAFDTENTHSGESVTTENNTNKNEEYIESRDMPYKNIEIKKTQIQETNDKQHKSAIESKDDPNSTKSLESEIMEIVDTCNTDITNDRLRSGSFVSDNEYVISDTICPSKQHIEIENQKQGLGETSPITENVSTDLTSHETKQNDKVDIKPGLRTTEVDERNLSEKSQKTTISPSVAFTMQTYTEHQFENAKIEVMRDRHDESLVPASFTDSTERSTQHFRTHSTGSEIFNSKNDLTPLVGHQQNEKHTSHLPISEEPNQCRSKAEVHSNDQVKSTLGDVKPLDVVLEANANGVSQERKSSTILCAKQELIKDDEAILSQRPNKSTITHSNTTNSSSPTTPTRKLANLVKKTEEEKRLEREAQELIENYQKVKREAEKLFEVDIEENIVDDGDVFDLGDAELKKASMPKALLTSTIKTIIEGFLTAERSQVLPPFSSMQASDPYKVHQDQSENNIRGSIVETESQHLIHTTEEPTPLTVETKVKLSSNLTSVEPISQARIEPLNFDSPVEHTAIDLIEDRKAMQPAPVEKHSPVQPIDKRIIVGVENERNTTPKITACKKKTDFSKAATARCVRGKSDNTVCFNSNDISSNNGRKSVFRKTSKLPTETSVQSRTSSTSSLGNRKLESNTDSNSPASHEQDVANQLNMDENDLSLLLQPLTLPYEAAPPPTYSRLPPDGHEFPPSFCEPSAPNVTSSNGQSTNNCDNDLFGKKLSKNFEGTEMKIDPTSVFQTSTTTTTTKTTIITRGNETIEKDNSSSDKKSIHQQPNIAVAKNIIKQSSSNINESCPTYSRYQSETAVLPKTLPSPPVKTPRKLFNNRPVNYYGEESFENTTQPTKAIEANALPPPVQSNASSKEDTSVNATCQPTSRIADQTDFQACGREKSSLSKLKLRDWHKDEKSDRSVRDKIAMFSMDDRGSSLNGSTPHLNVHVSSGNKALNWSSENLLETNINGSERRFKTLPTALNKNCGNIISSTTSTEGKELFVEAAKVSFTTRALSMENLYSSSNETSGKSTMKSKQQEDQSLSKYSESLQSLHAMPCYDYSSLRRNTIRPQTLERRTSFSGCTMSDEASKKVAHILDRRRRNITKLRGLVIPERPLTLQPILDLPEIKSRNSDNPNISDYSTESRDVSGRNVDFNSKADKTGISVSVKTPHTEKNHQSYIAEEKIILSSEQAPSMSTHHWVLEPPPQPPAKPPRTSLCSSTIVCPTLGSNNSSSLFQNDENDSDSVCSLKVCSSPSMSPSVVPEKFALTRTLSSETNTSISSSTTSTLTSGSASQASCSSVGSTPTVDLSRRVTKTSQVSSNVNKKHLNPAAAAVAANRKSILASSKCRSGRGESSLLHQRCQTSDDDEDSTDDYDEEIRRVSHKTRSRNNLVHLTAGAHATPKTTTITQTNISTSEPSVPINYKLVNQDFAITDSEHSNSIVDKVINVAAFVEVTTSASDTADSSQTSEKTNTSAPSNTSAILINEEHDNRFKTPTCNNEKMTHLDKIRYCDLSFSSEKCITNEIPRKTTMTQEEVLPMMSKPSTNTLVSIPEPIQNNRTRTVVKSSGSEMHRWLQSEMAKSTNRPTNNVSNKTKNSSEIATEHSSSKPMLAEFKCVSNIGRNENLSTAIDSKRITKPMRSTAELRERFERNCSIPSSKPDATKYTSEKSRNTATDKSYPNCFSSLDSVNSSTPELSSSTHNILSTHERKDFDSFSSLENNQSLITAQDLWQIMEESDPPLKHFEAFIVLLQRNTPESSVGITLAGGADYETKEVTINKILPDSPAARDGRLRKGDRILAVNGMSMRGLTHNESVLLLKTPRKEVTLVVTRSESIVAEPSKKRFPLGSLTSLLDNSNTELQLEKKQRKSYHSASRSLDNGLDSVAIDNSIDTTKENNSDSRNSTMRTSQSSSSASSMDSANVIGKQGECLSSATCSSSNAAERRVIVCKNIYGLGFSLEGGYDSPLGDRPLLIRKVFYGGAAHSTGQIKPGDEIIAINGLSTAKMSRIEVWNYMKELPMGDVEMVLL